jgi:hypothetical protein
VTTSREVLESVHARVDARISNPKCPFCDTNEWITLTTYALESIAWHGAAAAPVTVAARGASDTGASTGATDGPDDDLENRPLLAVAFACAQCKFVRFHHFTV